MNALRLTFASWLGVVLWVVLAWPRPVHAQPAPAPGAPVQLSPAEQKAADMRLPDLDRSALTPDSRQPMKVEEDERNPFGMVTKVLDQMVSAEPVSEERRIRQLLSNLRVAGVSDSPSGRRVLIGSLSLGEGEVLPPLFVGQGEKLQVKSITERGVVLRFLESDSAREERNIGLPIDLTPRVNSLKVGEFFVKSVPLDEDGSPQLPPLELETVRSVLQAAEQQDLQSLVERRTELFNAPAIPPAQEEGGQP